MVTLSKVSHKGEIGIKLSFPYSFDTVQLIKSIETATYSKTLRSWHIAYTTRSYHLFKKLHLPFKIIPEQIDTGTTGCAEPTCVFGDNQYFTNTLIINHLF